MGRKRFISIIKTAKIVKYFNLAHQNFLEIRQNLAKELEFPLKASTSYRVNTYCVKYSLFSFLNLLKSPKTEFTFSCTRAGWDGTTAVPKIWVFPVPHQHRTIDTVR